MLYPFAYESYVAHAYLLFVAWTTRSTRAGTNLPLAKPLACSPCWLRTVVSKSRGFHFVTVYSTMPCHLSLPPAKFCLTDDVHLEQGNSAFTVIGNLGTLRGNWHNEAFAGKS